VCEKLFSDKNCPLRIITCSAFNPNLPGPAEMPFGEGVKSLYKLFTIGWESYKLKENKGITGG
jgi:hypothetical protein